MEGAPRAVFVDPTGRRGRLVARTCWVLGALGVAYVALVVLALLLPPSLSRLSVPGLGPVLPGPGAPALGAAEGEEDSPEVLLAPSPRASRSPRPTPAPASRRPSPRPSTTPPSAATSPVPRAEPSRGNRGRPTAAASDAPADPGRPTTAPTRQATKKPTTAPGPQRSPKPRPSTGRGRR